MRVIFLHEPNVNDVGTYVSCFPHIGKYNQCFDVLIFMRSVAARLSATQGLLQAVLRKTNTVVIVQKN